MRILTTLMTIPLLMTALGGTAVAQDVFEPAPGSELRATLLDAFRPFAAFDLGAPIEFRVSTMRVAGDTAFVQVFAQRPGGAEIDLVNTPMVEWRYSQPYEIDGPRFEVFYVQRDGIWQPVNYALGSSDVWWSSYRCDVFAAVLYDYGC